MDDADMTDDVSIDLDEVVKLEFDLARARRVEYETESKILTDVGRQVHADAVSAAPRRTGDLAASIYLRGGKGYRLVGSDLKQGFFQEFGTSRNAPRPWLFPAAERGGDEIARRIERIADPLD